MKINLDENQFISTLSKGMRMKFALVLAMSHHAKLLIMDEPTSGLDPLVRSELLNILTEYMKDEGRGVLFSSHITSDLDKFADIIILIDKGKIVFVEEKDSLLDKHSVVKGDKKYLTQDNKKLFLSLYTNEYGFYGLSNQVEMLKKNIPDLICERANIEQLMIAYVGGGYDND